MRVRPAVLPDDREDIDRLLDEAAADGYPALSEEARVALDATVGEAGWLAEGESGPAGIAHRREHRGSIVVESAVAGPQAAQAAGALYEAVAALDGDTRLWSADAAAAGVFESCGATVSRRLIRLQRSLPAAAPGPVDEVRIVPFRPVHDVGAYLVVANDAFSGHPESGGWTRETFAERADREWFDPAGLFLAWGRGKPLGACWTKVHPDGAGEIYSIAVRPSAGGRGLGRALVLRGFEYLHAARGIDVGMLWVDAANEAGVRLYRGLGMEPVRERVELLPVRR